MASGQAGPASIGSHSLTFEAVELLGDAVRGMDTIAADHAEDMRALVAQVEPVLLPWWPASGRVGLRRRSISEIVLHPPLHTCQKRKSQPF